MVAGIFTLDEFTALNDQLAALVEAGVPIDAKLSDRGADPKHTLAAINAIVSRRVRHGETLPQALEGDEHDLPDSYRGFMQLAVRAGTFDTVLVGSHRMAESAIESRYAARSAWFYPLLVSSLAIIGLVAFCLFFVPTLENMYESLRLAPGGGLQILHALRTSLPYWAGLLSIAVLLIIAWNLRSKGREANSNRAATTKMSLATGWSAGDFQLRCANFAEAMADIIGHGEPLADALKLAGEASGDAALCHGARTLAASLAKGQFPSVDSPDALRFPPFLRWAIWHSEATVGRERALHMAGRIYREAAERRFERERAVVPLLALVIVGGGATLLYGLALFVPVVELLRALAS